MGALPITVTMETQKGIEKETGISSTEAMLEEQEDKELNEDVFDEGQLDEVRQENGGSDDFEYEFNGRKYNLTLKQKMFCIAYLEEGGNGVEAIIKAGYEVRYKDNKGQPIPFAYNRKLAAVMAYEMLKKPHITSFVNSKLEEYGFTDDHVDKQHLFLLNQSADMKVKMAAIKHFNELKGRIIKKVDHTSNGQTIIGLQMIVPEGANPKEDE